MQVEGHGHGSPEPQLVSHTQVLGHITGSTACGRGCEAQEAAHSHTFPQHLHQRWAVGRSASLGKGQVGPASPMGTRPTLQTRR